MCGIIVEGQSVVQINTSTSVGVNLRLPAKRLVGCTVPRGGW